VISPCIEEYSRFKSTKGTIRPIYSQEAFKCLGTSNHEVYTDIESSILHSIFIS
jgi:hypothetical protein